MEEFGNQTGVLQCMAMAMAPGSEQWLAGRPLLLTAASRRDGRVGGTCCAPQIGEVVARRS